ncbi:MAG: hypothetical protein HY269_06610 [Deltaproteobacteria bacterium]|nr:hypothetical protein [Deltaproteobacteria bacterium]
MVERRGVALAIRKFAAQRWQMLVGAGSVLVIGTGLVVTELLSAYCHYAAEIEVRLHDQSLNLPPGIYAAPRHVSVGELITEDELSERLLRAGNCLPK